jgi:hypothetical protein
MRTVGFRLRNETDRGAPQAEPTPSRTRADACHAPCHRSRHPGHERVVTGTNPRCSGLSPTIAAASARTWPARPDATCSERGCARVRRDHLGQRRQPEAFCAASLHPLFLDSAWNAVGGISRRFSRSRFRTRRSAHSLFLLPRPVDSDRSGNAVIRRLSRPPTAPGQSGRAVPRPAPTTTPRSCNNGARSTTAPDRHWTNCVKRWSTTNRAIIRRCRRPASTADPVALPASARSS